MSAALVWVVGCGKKEEPAPPTVQETQKATDTAAGEVQKAAETAKTTAATAVDTAKAKAQEIIDKAKSLVGENKYQDALNTLQGLAGMSLTDEQQKIVDGLRSRFKS